jgi:RHS repeat-associated protein
MIPWSGASCTSTVVGNPIYYVEDLLGTSRVITSNIGVVCYDADFYPYGGERPYTNTCSQNYKFEGKERDTETGNDDFGARYYSNRFGRWLSADWSSVPVAVPYANLTNPQTLNLYAMVADDPESFADLDGHCPECPAVVEEAEEEVEELAATPTGQAIIQKVGQTLNAIDEASAPVAEAVNKTADWITNGTFKVLGALVSILPAGDNAPPKKKDDPNQNDKNKPGKANSSPSPSPNPQSPPAPPVVASSRRHTRDKHTKPHPSRTGDKLRKRPDWRPKKKGGDGPSPPPPKKPRSEDPK